MINAELFDMSSFSQVTPHSIKDVQCKLFFFFIFLIIAFLYVLAFNDIMIIIS